MTENDRWARLLCCTLGHMHFVPTKESQAPGPRAHSCVLGPEQNHAVTWLQILAPLEPEQSNSQIPGAWAGGDGEGAEKLVGGRCDPKGQGTLSWSIPSLLGLRSALTMQGGENIRWGGEEKDLN